MIIYCLLAALIALILISFLLFDGDIVSPAFVTCVTFFVSAVSCLYGIKSYWGGDIHWTTFGVITVGLSVYIIFSWLVLARRSEVSNGNELIKADFQAIHVQKPLIVIFCMLAAISAIAYYSEMITFVSRWGSGNTWNEIMISFRTLTASDFNIDVQFSKTVSWPLQFVIMSGYVLLYIIINNVMAGEKFSWPLLMVTAAVLLFSVMLAERGALVRYPIAALVLYYLMWRKKAGWERIIGIKLIITCIIILVLVAAAFIMARGLVGRYTTSDPLHELAKYSGGPIVLLDLYLRDPVPSSGLFASETFRGVYSFVGRYFGIEQYYETLYSEFRWWNGVSIGNAYGIFRPYIQDFGYVGGMLFVGITSMISSYLYKLCRYITTGHTGTKYRHHFLILFYAYTSYTIFLQFYGHSLRHLVVPGEIKNIIFMYIIFQIFIRLRFTVSSSRAGASPEPVSRYVKRGRV